MSNLNNEYQKIIADIEKKITDPEELKFVKEKISELTFLFMNTVDKVTRYSQEKLDNMEEKQDDLEERLERIQKSLTDIEKDIYTDEDEFEVICPYCNNQFVSDIDLEETIEIQCPECKNMIELDWNDDDNESCSGSCHGCKGCIDSRLNDDENEDDM